MKIVVEVLDYKPVAEQRCEVVERKGLGHPDSITDAVVESMSLALSREYRTRFGTVLHHNLDKAFLAGGSVDRRFGGGRVIEPMRLFLGDRATFQSGDQTIRVNEIAVAAAKQWLSSNLRFVDIERHILFQSEIKPGSTELREVFSRNKGLLGANDTSAGVGYAPLTNTESLVLKTELYLNSKEFKQDHPESGEDVKVMAVRDGKDLQLTISMPLIDRYVKSEKDYFQLKRSLHKEIRAFVSSKWKAEGRIDVALNSLDKKGHGMEGMYLSVIGTSAEDADSGQVGRGNRVNGLIAFNRPCSLEASAGKNAVSHVGKIYNVLSNRIAHNIYDQIEGVREVMVWLVSRIGVPINRPALADIKILTKRGTSTTSMSRKIQRLVEKELSDIASFCSDLMEGKYSVI